MSRFMHWNTEDRRQMTVIDMDKENSIDDI